METEDQVEKDSNRNIENDIYSPTNTEHFGEAGSCLWVKNGEGGNTPDPEPENESAKTDHAPAKLEYGARGGEDNKGEEYKLNGKD